MNQPNDNKGAAQQQNIATLALTFDMATFHLDVQGAAPNEDVFLSMLAQAQRYFEDRRRMAVAASVQQQVQQQREGMELARRIAGRA